MRAAAAASEVADIDGPTLSVSPPSISFDYPQRRSTASCHGGISLSSSDATSRALLASSAEEAIQEGVETNAGRRENPDESAPQCLKETGSA
jgi:hypothetical protein